MRNEYPNWILGLDYLEKSMDKLNNKEIKFSSRKLVLTFTVEEADGGFDLDMFKKMTKTYLKAFVQTLLAYNFVHKIDWFH